MKMVFQQKVNEKEAKLKQSEEELYARHREMKEALEKQRLELEDKKRRLESGQALEPEKVRLVVSLPSPSLIRLCSARSASDDKEEGIPPNLDLPLSLLPSSHHRAARSLRLPYVRLSIFRSVPSRLSRLDSQYVFLLVQLQSSFLTSLISSTARSLLAEQLA